MSELTLFQSGNQLPDYLRANKPLSAITRSLMGNDNKRISIEGSVFRMIVGGQEVAVNEDRAMNMVVLRAADTNSRTYYGGTYERGMKVKPTCFSDDCQRPSPKVKNPQHSNCQQCPQNIKGSGTKEDTRACRFQRRLAVVLENNIGGDIYAMSIPAMSLFAQGEGRKMGLQQYARFLGGHGVDINAVVTEFRFDTASSSPKLIFNAVRALTADEYELVKSRHNEEAAVNAVTMTVGELDGAEDENSSQKPTTTPQPQNTVTNTQTQKTVAAAPAGKSNGGSSGFTIENAVPEPSVKTSTPTPPKDIKEIMGAWGSDVDD